MPSLRATRTMRTFLKSATRDMGAFLIVLMLLAGLTAQSSAQQVFGSITGTITDASGAGVPNATVEITETSKGVNFTTRTNGSGLYTQGQLIPGRYVVTVEAPSFARVTSSGLVVNVDQVTRFDAALPLGDVTQTVQVTSEAPLLQTDRADVATTLSSDQVIHLPTYQRSVLALEFITPGVLSNPSSTPTAENPQGSFRARVNGQIWGTTGYQLDGTDNQDAWLGSAIINPSPDSVAESKFSTQNFDAENGYVAGGMFTISTKSGTNDTHGSLFEYIINSSPGFETVAANPFTQPNGAPPLKSHQFGGSLGGHVLRKKLFYFGDVQIQRRKETDSVLTTVPTALARSTCGLGSTSSVCDLSDYLQGGTFQIYDPLTGNPSTGQARSTFASNRIPINRISPQAQRIMSYFPLPNVANASPNNIRNYIANGAQVFNSEQYNTREDFYLNEKNLFFGRYTIGNFSLAVPGAFGTLAGGPGLDSSGYSGNSRTTNQSLALGYTRIFSASLINEFRFGFYKYNVHTFPGGYGTTPATDAGIPNLNQDSSFTSGLPAFGIPTAGTTMYLGYSLTANRCNCPLAETERQYQFVDNLTKTVGNHSLKFGVDFRRTANLRVPSDGHRSGELTFAAGYTGLGNTSGGSSAGLGLATFLLGQTTTFSRYVSTVTDATAYLYRGHFFGQDTWRVTPKLTLSYGLRWELTFPESTAPGKGGLLDLNTGNVVIYGVGGNSTHGYQQMVYDNFAPRLGVSYLVTPKTVLRGGYGWAYSAGWGGSIFNQANITLPVVLAQSNTPANASQGVFDLATGPPSSIFPQTIGASCRYQTTL